MPAIQFHYARHPLCQIARVCHDDERHAFLAIQFDEQVSELFCGSLI